MSVHITYDLGGFCAWQVLRYVNAILSDFMRTILSNHVSVVSTILPKENFICLFTCILASSFEKG